VNNLIVFVVAIFCSAILAMSTPIPFGPIDLDAYEVVVFRERIEGHLSALEHKRRIRFTLVKPVTNITKEIPRRGGDGWEYRCKVTLKNSTDQKMDCAVNMLRVPLLDFEDFKLKCNDREYRVIKQGKTKKVGLSLKMEYVVKDDRPESLEELTEAITSITKATRHMSYPERIEELNETVISMIDDTLHLFNAERLEELADTINSIIDGIHHTCKAERRPY